MQKNKCYILINFNIFQQVPLHINDIASDIDTKFHIYEGNDEGKWGKFQLKAHALLRNHRLTLTEKTENVPFKSKEWQLRIYK